MWKYDRNQSGKVNIRQVRRIIKRLAGFHRKNSRSKTVTVTTQLGGYPGQQTQTTTIYQ